MSERGQYVRQVETLIASKELHGSDSLCKLLRYLANHALDHPGEPLKEYQIATEVFGRSSDFDPQLDSIIRVQAGRLRSKLAKYYESEGANDPLVVDLPKGTYLLSFHHRGRGGAKLLGIEHERGLHAASLTSGRPGMAVAMLSILLLISVAVVVLLLINRKSADAASAHANQ